LSAGYLNSRFRQRGIGWFQGSGRRPAPARWALAPTQYVLRAGPLHGAIPATEGDRAQPPSEHRVNLAFQLARDTFILQISIVWSRRPCRGALKPTSGRSRSPPKSCGRRR
jgi:hypothetical protein